jgi:hypothetical protein
VVVGEVEDDEGKLEWGLKMPVREPAFMVFGLRMTAWGSKRCSLWGGGKAWLRFGKRVWTAEEILAYKARKAESARYIYMEPWSETKST